MVEIPVPAKALTAGACAALCLALGACAKTVSTGAFSGEQKEVAQAVSNLQSDVTAADQSKICSNDLAARIVARLNAAPGGCKAVIKEQVAEIDSAELSIQSVQLSGAGAQRSAKASVRSKYAGKTRSGTVSLLKEGGKWKISALS
jgi:ribosomal protein S20